MKIAVVHDWLSAMRGGEKVLESILELYPHADLFTLFHIKGSVSPFIENRKIYTSFLQRAPFLKSHYRHYLPLFPSAIKSLHIKNYDLVISSTHCVAKGISISGSIPHISYCHTPMRYLWLMEDEYFKNTHPLTRTAFKTISTYLKREDLYSNRTVHKFIANSQNVAERIKSFYHRSADVIYPPVDTHTFFISPKPKAYYLLVSAFVPYKKIDLAIQAFNELGLPLFIVGRGPDETKLKKMAKKNIHFLGWRSTEELPELYAHCKAFIFPADEDFGISPVEAMAAGRPVIAYAKGGALETVTATTGLFFHEQTPTALIHAVREFQKKASVFDPYLIKSHAEKFDRRIFKIKFSDYVQKGTVGNRAEKEQVKF